ncbi:DUF2243 domain-containing protein [Cellulomonas wangsupingiae]|uniref:DUF2243 domain-containing protein n=1 Tax=Cellulomonas wangsupingiae TaxID=2968085 RepID=A0ABY5K720_9CELL|nr:DUF2243 domain-containing protein [Cellulomonas wangsupingiae]MCC2333677.1 DUF2243 domain-containing protein [Cellulomonas wangsupingiae]UUI64942.1 DUF2243 domain-containing protein [Cellulomonas wangsupingiae]
MTADLAPTSARRRSAGAAALVGAGVMAAVDEIVFHQVLAWHHFYDRGTPDVALLSDGLLHAAELVALVAGFFLLADLRRRGALVVPAAWSGFFLGAGGFQLVDALVDHKLLRVHQIRYGVDLLPYDLAWTASAVLLLGIGAVLWRRARRAVPARAAA